MKKVRLCLTCIALALMMIVCSVGASAALLFDAVIPDDFVDDFFIGEADVTVNEAVYAISEYLGVPTDDVAKSLEFTLEADKKRIMVYEADELVEIVLKDSSGAVCLMAAQYSVVIENGTTKEIITNLSVGMSSGFTMGTKAFNFLVDNSLTSFVIGVGFCSAAFGLIKRALRVSKRM
ncbi:MAG: hypothetical protein E7485_06470 [Ruminococcaceae bacterium]|nr:hypothetical protein [Oscillospiraceae bacterium]